MTEILADLTELLSKDQRLVVDGKLLKNKVIELGLIPDPALLKALLSVKVVKKHFFQDVDGIFVFDKIKFQKFVSNKAFLPDSYTAYRNKIGLINENGDYFSDSREIVLAWPFKDCLLEGGQTLEDQKRQEIFWNETLAPNEIDRLLAPKVFTNWMRFGAKGKHALKAQDSIEPKAENLVVRGNNLLVLHSLAKTYSGEVKLVYIDPPYNTGNDSFGYNDSFKHSTWLTFMRNRLEIAKILLRKDGVIFINIDDKEYSYLKVVCDEVFGRENFLNVICVKTSDPSGHKTVNPSPYSQTEYVLMYAKSKSSYRYDIRYVASDYDSGYNQVVLNPNDDFSKWRFTGLFDFLAKEKGYENTRDANKKLGEPVFRSIVADFALKNKGRVFQPVAIADDASKEIVDIRERSKNQPEKIFSIEREKDKIYILNGRQMYFYSSKVKVVEGIETPAKPLTNLWTDIPYNGIAREGGVRLKNGKKPEKLLKRIIEISTEPKDLVLDFNAGSGTTLAVAHKMGRRYIGVEQLDYEDNDFVERLTNVIKGDETGVSASTEWKGGGAFLYCELRTLNEEFVEKIGNAKETKELLKIWDEMQEHGFLSYRVNLKALSENQSEFRALEIKVQKKILLETLDLNQLYLNYSEIDDADFKVSEIDKKYNGIFYGKA